MKAELVPLDMYILLDKSGSMEDATGVNGSGPTKWEAVTAALEAFFSDPASAALGVGLQFFPLSQPGVPDSCTHSSQCGDAGPCLLKACEEALLDGDLVPCDQDSDCGFFDECAQLGVCKNDSGYVCLYQANPEGECSGGLGTCMKITQSYCVNKDSCAAADYEDPAVGIAPLSSAAQALSAAIAATEPGGATPTAPALSGAIGHAREWAQQNPGHKVVAVMATDGLPTECEPQAIGPIADIAEGGLSGDPSVVTFVIGVFGAGDAGAQDNLDDIAKAGGSNSAFFIADNQDVAQAFLAALQAIQGETLGCEYQVPEPPDGSDLDYGKVNVGHTPPGESSKRTIFYVGSEAACDAAEGGWYYDQKPLGNQVPTKILMCPATCAELSAQGGQVSIEMGCETIVPK